MNNLQSYLRVVPPQYTFSRRHIRHGHIRALVTLLLPLVAGCISTAPLHLQNHFPIDPNPSEALQAKLTPSSSERIPLGMAIVGLPDSHGFIWGPSESSSQIAARVKDNMESSAPVSMEEFIFVKDLSSPESLSLIQRFGKENQVDTILMVLPSGKEVSGPAQFDLLPESSLLHGRQVDHHATVELGLVDTNSGKLFLQVQGQSYATLEELDIPINSNRYPRVRGSAMNTFIYPAEGQALEILRAVALDEALEQATMKLQEKWPKT